jgi:hypothetical protein
MTEVAVASRAVNLRSNHPVAGVQLVPDGIFGHWLKKGGPTGTWVELRSGAEQRLAAGRAIKRAVTVIIEERQAESSFRSAAAQDRILLFGKQLFPYLLGVDDFVRARRPLRRQLQPRGGILSLLCPG